MLPRPPGGQAPAGQPLPYPSYIPLVPPPPLQLVWNGDMQVPMPPQPRTHRFRKTQWVCAGCNLLNWVSRHRCRECRHPQIHGLAPPVGGSPPQRRRQRQEQAVGPSATPTRERGPPGRAPPPPNTSRAEQSAANDSQPPSAAQKVQGLKDALEALRKAHAPEGVLLPLQAELKRAETEARLSCRWASASTVLVPRARRRRPRRTRPRRRSRQLGGAWTRPRRRRCCTRGSSRRSWQRSQPMQARRERPRHWLGLSRWPWRDRGALPHSGDPSRLRPLRGGREQRRREGGLRRDGSHAASPWWPGDPVAPARADYLSPTWGSSRGGHRDAGDHGQTHGAMAHQ